MSVRNFWTIFLKILGIWLVIDGVSIIPSFISVIPFYGKNDNPITLILLSAGIYFFVLWFFVFKTSWLIDKLKLEKGFVEENIEFDIKSSSIITIATIVFGGLIFIDSLPQFCKETISFFHQKRMFIDNPASGLIIFHLVKSVIGYLMMTNSQIIVKLFDGQEKKQ